MRHTIPPTDCPYNYLEPVINPTMFFGREKEIDSIVDGVVAPRYGRRSFLVSGGPRIGKTSLLFELTRRLIEITSKRSGSVIPVYIDVGKIVPEASFQHVWAGVSRSIETTLTTTGPDLRLKSIANDYDAWMKAEATLICLRDIGFRVVLLLDNIDDPSVSSVLLRHLRALHLSASHHGVLRYVMAAKRAPLEDHPGSPLDNILVYIRLGVLNKQEASSLINIPTHKSLSPRVIDELHLQSGDHPFLLQYLMTYLWDRLHSGLPVEDIQEAINVFFETRPDFRRWYTGHLTDQDIAVYEVISREKRISVSDLRRMMLMDQAMIQDALNSLATTGLIHRVNVGTYEVSGEMFQRWFSLYHSRKSTQGDSYMTIEQDALKVAEFLRTLREQIITHPEFGRIYGDTGRVDQQVTHLASALALNYDRLQEARRNQTLFPGRRQYQDDVDTYLQGLSTTTLEIEKLWRQFRADVLTGTESLIIRIEQEAPKRSLLDNTLAGLRKFKDFLGAALDIKKAVTEWSPELVDTVQDALDQLGKISLPGLVIRVSRLTDGFDWLPGTPS